MLTLFGKKKLTEEKVANIFVNGIQEIIDQGFDDVVGLIQDSPEFLSPPTINSSEIGPFALIVISGNIQEIPKYFSAGQDKRITELILTKLADIYEMDKMELAKRVSETRKLMSRKNHRSKSVVNAMSMALFCRYQLNNYQEDYFKSVHAPNPILNQRLKDALENFMWDWKLITDKYKVVPRL